MEQYSQLDRIGLARVLEDLPIGVVVLDPHGRVVLFNRYEEQLARRTRETVLGQRFFESVAPCMNVKDLAGYFFENIGREVLSRSVEFSFGFPHLDSPRDVHVRMYSIEDGGAPFGCLLIEDVSAKRAVEEMKDSLSQLLVHDLKNPLAATLGNLELIKELPEALPGSELLEIVDDAFEGAQRLQSMVLDLLDITRLKSAGVPLSIERLDAVEIAKETVRQAQAIARPRGREVVLDPARPAVAWLRADADFIRRSLHNLVENGIQHSARRVVMRVAADEERVLFEVEDDGPGVPPDLQDKIFDPYARVVNESRKAARGHNRGLGLTLVQMAVRAHGGDVCVDSNPGGGSRFHVTFPRRLESSGQTRDLSSRATG